MHKALTAILLLALLLSGCSGGGSGKDGGSTSATPTASTPTDAAAEGPDGTNGTGAPGPFGPPNNASLPTNVTSFSWSAQGNGSRAFEFVFQISTSSACQDDWSITAPTGQGSSGAFLRDGDGGTSQATGIHTNGQSTRTAEPSAYGGSGSQPSSSGLRTYRLFVEAGGPASTEAWSASLAFECGAPFNVTVARVAPLWGVFDVLEMESSFASAVPAGATSATDGTITLEASGDATAWLWAGGASQGEWGVTSPSGSTNHALGPGDTLVTADGTAGAWTFTLEGSAAYGSGIWGALAGPFEPFVPA